MHDKGGRDERQNSYTNHERSEVDDDVRSLSVVPATGVFSAQMGRFSFYRSLLPTIATNIVTVTVTVTVTTNCRVNTGR